MNFSAVCAIKRCSAVKSSGVVIALGLVSVSRKFPPVRCAGKGFGSDITPKDYAAAQRFDKQNPGTKQFWTAPGPQALSFGARNSFHGKKGNGTMRRKIPSPISG